MKNTEPGLYRALRCGLFVCLSLSAALAPFVGTAQTEEPVKKQRRVGSDAGTPGHTEPRVPAGYPAGTRDAAASGENADHAAGNNKAQQRAESRNTSKQQSKKNRKDEFVRPQ